MRRIGIISACFLSATACHLRAQPQVPSGFSATRISTVDTNPKLFAIDDPEGFGVGVISASASNGVAVFQLLTPSGSSLPIATYIDPLINTGQANGIYRVRVAPPGPGGGLLHASIVVKPASQFGTRYVTISTSGQVTELFTRVTTGQSIGFDFEFGGGVAGNPSSAVLYDRFGPPTELAVLTDQLTLNIILPDSVPTGRTDIDIMGFSRDVTGSYGGGILIAESSLMFEQRSAIYELRDATAGGTYRPISDVPVSTRRYRDLDIAAAGSFGGVAYVTEVLTDEVQQVAPDGSHSTWATGFVGIGSLSISPDGESMYVADQNGVWLVRPIGNEPGPAVVTTDPSVPDGSKITGQPVDAIRIILSEPVSFLDTDVSITDSGGQPVGFDVSGSGSSFMIIGLAEPLSGNTYTVTLADSITSVSTGQPLDGDNDGVAGEDAILTFIHNCAADQNFDGMISPADFSAWVANFNLGC